MFRVGSSSLFSVAQNNKWSRIPRIFVFMSLYLRFCMINFECINPLRSPGLVHKHYPLYVIKCPPPGVRICACVCVRVCARRFARHGVKTQIQRHSSAHPVYNVVFWPWSVCFKLYAVVCVCPYLVSLSARERVWYFPLTVVSLPHRTKRVVCHIPRPHLTQFTAQLYNVTTTIRTHATHVTPTRRRIQRKSDGSVVCVCVWVSEKPTHRSAAHRTCVCNTYNIACM